MHHHKKSVSLFRNFVFGVEDSLVSTVGLLSGIALVNTPRETIFLTGVVLIFVEAFSMSAGSFLSETSAEFYENGVDRFKSSKIADSLVMFFSYFISGFVPLTPYFFWPVESALKLSIIFSVFALFVLGLVSAKLSNISLLKNALRMMIIGGLAILVGSIAGSLISFIN